MTHSMLRTPVLAVLLSALGACAGFGGDPPAELPEPEPAADTASPPEPVPAPEPEPSLRERWAAPFAVRGEGRPAVHGTRTVVVLRDSAARPAPARVAADTVAADTVAARRAATAPPSTARPSTARPPSAAPARAPSAPRGAGVRTHRVEWGETWLGIARQYGLGARDLAAANPQVDPERLRSGQVLRIPGAGGRAGARRTHTVTAGETLWGIARRYGVSTEEVRRANRLTDDRVRLGQSLVIPPPE